MQRIIIHEAAEIAPPLEGEALDAFVDVVRRFGVDHGLDPIVGVRVREPDGSMNGTVAVLSGRTNLIACEKLGLSPKIAVYEGSESPAELAASLNLLRPHLSKDQRAAVAVEIEQRFAIEARKRQKTALGASKSLLVKLPKAPDPRMRVDGKSSVETQVELVQLSRNALAKRYVSHFPEDRALLGGLHREAMVSRLVGRLFDGTAQADAAAEAEAAGDDPAAELAADAAAIHARDRAARICCVSSTYVGRAKLVWRDSPDVFRQLITGKVSLGAAVAEVRRQAKRKSITAAAAAAATLGPLRVKPLDGGIRCGDSIKLLPTLPRQKFRLIFADPPYNQGVDYGKGTNADRLPESVYLAWCEKWIRQLPELLTPDGSAWVMISDEYAAEYVLMLKRTGLKMRSWVKWYETFGGNCAEKFNRTSRHLLYFTRDARRFVFNPEAFNRQSFRQMIYCDGRAVEAGKIHDDVWAIPRLTGNDRERIPDFPTQLPYKLVRPIVEGCSDEGDNCLDPFSGSGTFAVCCKQHGRNGIGIEVSEQFAASSRARWLGVPCPNP